MQKIDTYLNDELIRRSRNWQALKDILVLALPPEILQRVVYAVTEDTALTLFCESPAWTSKLRFYDTEIKKIFRLQGEIVRTVKVRTIPPLESGTSS